MSIWLLQFLLTCAFVGTLFALTVVVLCMIEHRITTAKQDKFIDAIPPVLISVVFVSLWVGVFGWVFSP